MSHKLNMLRIKSVYTALDELGPQVIFIGGATVSLYAERLTEEVRPTEDVDRNNELRWLYPARREITGERLSK
jgi:hypothetical protein